MEMMGTGVDHRSLIISAVVEVWLTVEVDLDC